MPTMNSDYVRKMKMGKGGPSGGGMQTMPMKPTTGAVDTLASGGGRFGGPSIANLSPAATGGGRGIGGPAIPGGGQGTPKVGNPNPRGREDTGRRGTFTGGGLSRPGQPPASGPIMQPMPAPMPGGAYDDPKMGGGLGSLGSYGRLNPAIWQAPQLPKTEIGDGLNMYTGEKLNGQNQANGRPDWFNQGTIQNKMDSGQADQAWSEYAKQNGLDPNAGVGKKNSFGPGPSQMWQNSDMSVDYGQRADVRGMQPPQQGPQMQGGPQQAPPQGRDGGQPQPPQGAPGQEDQMPSWMKARMRRNPGGGGMRGNPNIDWASGAGMNQGNLNRAGGPGGAGFGMMQPSIGQGIQSAGNAYAGGQMGPQTNYAATLAQYGQGGPSFPGGQAGGFNPQSVLQSLQGQYGNFGMGPQFPTQ